jgi:hypothetical protein
LSFLLSFICGDLVVVWAHTSGVSAKGCGGLWLGGCGDCGNCRWLGGNAPEDHGSGLLNGFQALAQKIGVSMPKLDVVLVMLGPT